MDNKLTISPSNLSLYPRMAQAIWIQIQTDQHSHLCALHIHTIHLRPHFWHNSIQLYFASCVCEWVCLSCWCLCPHQDPMPSVACQICFNIFFMSGLCQELCHTPFIKILFYFSIFCFFGVHLFSMTFPPCVCDIPACIAHTYIFHIHSIIIQIHIAHIFLCICMRDKKNNNNKMCLLQTGWNTLCVSVKNLWPSSSYRFIFFLCLFY